MIVLDASMTIAALFEDERTEAVVAAMDRAVTDGAVVPSIWPLEVANVLRSAVRRRRCDEDFVDHTLQLLGELPIRIDAETDRQAWGATRALSREQGLTIYDAAYLELAIRLRLSLASCDRALIAAANRLSVQMLTP